MRDSIRSVAWRVPSISLRILLTGFEGRDVTWRVLGRKRAVALDRGRTAARTTRRTIFEANHLLTARERGVCEGKNTGCRLATMTDLRPPSGLARDDLRTLSGLARDDLR